MPSETVLGTNRCGTSTNFSVRWAGQVKANYTETYTFYTYSDDGVRLWVNGVQLVNNWTGHGPTWNNGTIALTAGQWYDITLENYNGGGGGVIQLQYSSPSQAQVTIPASNLRAGTPTTLAQGALGLTVGAEGYYQKYSTVSGGSGAITANGPVTITGGSFTATSGTMTVNGVFSHSGGTFASNGGTLVLNSLASFTSGTAAAFNNVTSSGTLTVASGMTVAGIASLAAGSTLKTGGNITASAGSTFTVAGTSQLTGGFVTIQSNSPNYAMTLSGNVNVRFARIYNLADAGLTLDGAGTTTFDNVNFYAGQSTSTVYLRVANAAWNGHDFKGMAFQAISGSGNTMQINSAGSTVYVDGYATGAGWISGPASDIETAGTIVWAPTAAEGLSARAAKASGGVRVTWHVDSERLTAGYRVMRRSAERCGELLAEESSGSSARAEVLGSAGWRKVAEVPVTRPGGEPTGEEYSILDKLAPADGRCEYRVEELTAGGEVGVSVEARP